MDWSFSPDEIYGSFTREPWEHQARSIAAICSKFDEGVRSLVLGAPTAAGKGLLTTSLINLILSRGGKAIIYNSRKVLTQQSLDRLNEDGISSGARAASLHKMFDPHSPVQIGQLQTDIIRVLNQERWRLFGANLVIVDECHMAASEKPVELIQKYLGNGAYVLGLSGTPIGLSGIYKDITVSATNSELRACGAHVPVKCFSVHEFDRSKIKRERTGEFSDGQIMKHCWNQAVVGYIYKDWRRLNPDVLPTLCAAPGIGESIWLSEEFRNHGFRVAHIDYEKCVVNGITYPNDSNGETRNQVLADAKKGAFDVVFHCSILTEGFDWPDLRHLILARPYGNLANYIQAVGRVLRAAPGKHVAVLQDHGGNVVDHGSPNADRDWAAMFSMSEKEIREQRKRDVQEGKAPNPIVCPNCGTVRSEGPRCPACGFQADPRARVIVQKDGTLVEMKIDEFAPPKPKKPQEVTRLNQILFSMRNKSGRFPPDDQVIAIYGSKYGEYPSSAMIQAWIGEREAARMKRARA